MNKNEFTWISRYSDTDESDKQGRWARLCYYNGLLIAWVNRVTHVTKGHVYVVTDYFPSGSNDNPCYNDVNFSFDYTKQGIERRFNNFKGKIA